MEPQKNSIKEYLPSKQFTARIVIIILIFGITVGIYQLSIFIKTKIGKKGQAALLVKPDVIQKDSNDNGIPDWEESLWGLDPKGNGEKNKEFILAKRETLAKESGAVIPNGEPISENDTLAREFFSVVMSLQESGNLDDTALKAVSDTVGEKIVATPLKDVYTNSSITTIKNNPENTDKYYNDVVTIMGNYDDSDMGKELTFVSVALSHNDKGALAQAAEIAKDYRNIAKDMSKIKVPNSLSSIHLSMINNYEKVAQSIESMSGMLENPIEGMKAIINYKKYTDALATDIQHLSNSLD